MFNLFNNYKVYLSFIAIISLACYCGLLKYQNLKLVNDKLLLQSKVATYDIAINAANEMRARQEEELRLREQEAANAQAESDKRRDSVLNTQIQGGCKGANAFLIDYALGFKWHNTIP